MKKKISFLILMVFAFNIVFSQQVEIGKALEIGKKYLWERLSASKTPIDITQITATESFAEKNGELPLYYIFNFDKIGFIIVSADSRMYPVLGYSIDGTQYSKTDANENFTYWMNTLKGEIQYRINKNIRPDNQITKGWVHLEELNTERTSKSVSATIQRFPLIRSMWDQTSPYNDLCPVDGAGPGGHVYVGCVATAMSQIMYYYRYPITGSGTHSYTPSGYPTQTVNFGTTTYHWENMLNTPSSTVDNSIATLCWNAGVSVNMAYSGSGSGAYSYSVPNALQTYFKYTTNGIAYKSSYSTTVWRNMLMADLNALRPVYYSGNDPVLNEGHAFVCDGYQDGVTDTLFHFNWGWSGSDNGYFFLSEMNSGNGNFTSGQAAILGIYPASGYPYSCNSKTFTNTYGVIEDGSGYANDCNNNLDCSWMIAPYTSSGVAGIKLTFEEFDTEAGNDYLTIYDGPNEQSPVLGVYSGNTLPGVINSTNDTIFITYHTNPTIPSKGWVADYEFIPMSHCSGIVTLTDAAGTVEDGSGDYDYNNSSNCKWKFMPTGATTVTLHFTEFNTEPTLDFIKVYDKYSGGTLLGVYSGNTLPPDLTSTKGSMYIIFFSNSTVTNTGWKLNYTSNGTSGVENTDIINNIQVYPNPSTNGILNLNFNSKISHSVEIRLLDMLGKSVYQENIPEIETMYKETINLGSLKSGIYFLKISTDQGQVVKKIVIK